MTPEASARIESLVARCEAIADPALRGDVLELLRLLLLLHGEALGKMLGAASDAPHIPALLAAWKREADITALLELHELAMPQPPPAASASAADFVPLADLHRS